MHQSTPRTRQPVRLLCTAFGLCLLLLAACGGSAPATSDTAGSPGGEGSDAEVAASGAECADLEALAREEGTVSLYSSLPEEENRVLGDAFEEEYGIAVEVVRAGSLNILQRLYEELQAGVLQADVFHSLYPPGFYQLKEEGHLAAYESAEFDAYPDDPDFVDPDGMWGPLRIVANVIEWNTEALGDLPPPETWEDLLKPEYQGMLASADPTYGGTQFMQYYMWAEEYGDDYIRDLAAQDMQLVDSHGALSSVITTGERAIAVEMNDYQAWSDKYLDDAAVEYIYPPENVLVVPGQLSILEEAPHPCAARLFFDWLLSAEAQQIVQDEIGAYSAREDAEPIEGRPPLAEVDQYQPDWQYLQENLAEEQSRVVDLLRSGAQ